MTQAAVSYQIKLLEERVGAPLFLRAAAPSHADRHRAAAVGRRSREAFDSAARRLRRRARRRHAAC